MLFIIFFFSSRCVYVFTDDLQRLGPHWTLTRTTGGFFNFSSLFTFYLLPIPHFCSIPSFNQVNYFEDFTDILHSLLWGCTIPQNELPGIFKGYEFGMTGLVGGCTATCIVQMGDEYRWWHLKLQESLLSIIVLQFSNQWMAGVTVIQRWLRSWWGGVIYSRTIVQFTYPIFCSFNHWPHVLWEFPQHWSNVIKCE